MAKKKASRKSTKPRASKKAPETKTRVITDVKTPEVYTQKIESKPSTDSKTSSDDSKVMAILSYITIVGWLVAFILYTKKKDEFAAFHIRQGLMLQIAGTIVWILSSVHLLSLILAIVLLVLWILGFISAIEGSKKVIPGIGSYAQAWFKDI